MKKMKKIIIQLILTIAVATIAVAIFVAIEKKRLANNVSEDASIANENTKGKILGEEESQNPSRMYTSQNFHSPQIAIGGDAITLPSGQESLAPEITDMRSELLTTKNEQQVKFQLTWKTNKPCESSVEYMRGGQEQGKVITEDNYGYIHSAQISSLNFSTSYTYTIHAKDRWGNQADSEKLTFYTGAPNVSILDLLGGAFKDMFGWVNR